MRKIAIGASVMLFLLSLAANAYFFIDRVVTNYYSGVREDTRARIMDAYDQMLCDLICGKTIDEANEILTPNKVVRFKKRRDFGHLYIGKTRVEICLDGDVIEAVESSPYVGDKPECLMRVNIFDGTSQGDKGVSDAEELPVDQ